MRDQGRRQIESEGDLAGLKFLHTDRRLDRAAQDRIGLGAGDIFDLHTAFGRRHDGDPLGGTIQHDADVDLPLDFARGLDVESVNDSAARSGLVRYQPAA